MLSWKKRKKLKRLSPFKQLAFGWALLKKIAKSLFIPIVREVGGEFTPSLSLSLLISIGSAQLFKFVLWRLTYEKFRGQTRDPSQWPSTVGLLGDRRTVGDTAICTPIAESHSWSQAGLRFPSSLSSSTLCPVLQQSHHGVPLWAEMNRKTCFGTEWMHRLSKLSKACNFRATCVAY